MNEYKRSEVCRKLLPDFDVDAKSEENSKFEKLLLRWKTVLKCSSFSSQFYRSIDRNRRISRNIHQTNILKNDSRYNALYRLWSEIQAENSKQVQEIKKIFQLSRTGAKGMEDNKISKMRNMGKVWRSFIEEKFAIRLVFYLFLKQKLVQHRD